MHPLCLDFLTAAEASPPELAELAAANGCEAISFMVHPVAGVPDFGMAQDTPMRRDTKRRCAALGIAIDMVEGFLLTPETDVAIFRPSLESAEWLGAGCVNILLRDPELGRLAGNLSAFCDLAGEYGIAVVTEWSRRTPLKSPADAAAFLTANAPTARLQFDSLHLFRAGFSADDVAALDPGIVARGQLADGPADVPVERQFEEAMGERLNPGDGQLPLDSFVRALPDGIVIGIEIPMTSAMNRGISPEERVARAVTGTRALLARLDI